MVLCANTMMLSIHKPTQQNSCKVVIKSSNVVVIYVKSFSKVDIKIWRHDRFLAGKLFESPFLFWRIKLYGGQNQFLVSSNLCCENGLIFCYFPP